MKTFELNWDNYEEVNALSQKLKSRALQLKPNRITSAELQAEIYNACRDILEEDISHLYEKQDSTSDYYVYAHCDTSKQNIKTKRDGKTAFAASIGLSYFPFYIGKGRGNRAYDLNRNETHRKIKQRLAISGKQPEVVIIKNNLSSNEAFALESKLIDIFGVIGKGGKLVNLDEGKESLLRQSLYKDKLGIINPFHRL